MSLVDKYGGGNILIYGLPLIMAPLIAIAAALGWIITRFTLGYLRRQPDFPHKEEVMAGAKRGWLVVVGSMAAAGLVLWLALYFSFYPRTVGKLVVIVLALHTTYLAYRHPWYYLGHAAWLHWLKQLIFRRATDWKQFVARWERKRKSSWGPIWGALAVGMLVAMGLWWAESGLQYEGLAWQIRVTAPSENVVRVLSYCGEGYPWEKPEFGSIMIMVAPDTPRQEMKEILHSARQLVEQAEPWPRGSLDVWDGYRRMCKADWDTHKGGWGEEGCSWEASENEAGSNTTGPLPQTNEND